MFTGIITELGDIRSLDLSDQGLRMAIDIKSLAAAAELGDSIAVNGACLTVVSKDATVADFDVSPETLSKTNMASWQLGQQVNLESALCLGDKLGGHMVSGHVDGLGSLLKRTPTGDHEVFQFELPSDQSVQVVEKGSICIDGISLTCYNCHGQSFEIAVIPHTLQHTNLGKMQVGDRVHLEQDMIGRWVAKLLPQQMEN